MHVLVFERNLLWSSKLLQSLRGLGFSAAVAIGPPSTAGTAELAIVNLGEPEAESLIRSLQQVGIRVIAHAGHKDKNLLAIGTASGADRVVTNGELSFKIGQVIETLMAEKGRGAPAPP